ncbi:hypothetical protein ACIG53_03200 [Streptomyces bauhiniae]|uniref:hypothetical protein n=1 Tax=Streptomyces bauhiniae TaxID=2340725 RepID=UPI0037D15AA6
MSQCPAALTGRTVQDGRDPAGPGGWQCAQGQGDGDEGRPGGEGGCAPSRPPLGGVAAYGPPHGEAVERGEGQQDQYDRHRLRQARLVVVSGHAPRGVAGS